MKKEAAKYYLGLDIGIGSVGWGVIGEANGEHWLEDFGVRLFNVPEKSKNKKSLAEKRREFRGKRRLLNRRHCRREDLKKYFFTLFAEQYPHIKKNFKEFSKKQKPTNLLKDKYDETEFNPYVIRRQALSNEISQVELLYILLHINKYRGYKKFYLDDNLDEIEKLRQEIRESEDNISQTNNSEQQKGLSEKRRRLNELERKEENKAVAETERLFRENNYCSVAEMVIEYEKFRHPLNKNLLSAHNHNPEGIELSKLDKRSEKLSQDSQANEIIKQIVEETNKESLKWEKSKKYYEAIVALDDNKLSDSKKKIKLQAIVTTKFGKLNDKYLVFSRDRLVEETQKILEKQSEYYPQQLKRKFSYTSWENGKSETEELSAQEIILKIIFRQRDFEDGPGPGDQEKKVQWKANLKEVHHHPIEESRGYCQYFPIKKRGWHCSLIYCCFQFINEFSKISGLEEKELGGMEKVKEIHQQVFEWLISSSGYQPKTLSQEEKGKKRETFRKQLEKLLVELVGKGNYSFPKGAFSQEKGIKFKTDFLDYLKGNNNFYSALRKNCSSPKFYLNYEDYKKTIFYQIGQIIFEEITPQRRKNKLDVLSQRIYSLESFRDCLTKLGKYGEERSPASVSFHYMIEAIKTFLEDGKKYGEFQAKKKEELQKEQEKSENSGKGEPWSPWMRSDLVRNPVVFRSFNQTRKILKNLFLNYPAGFAAINIETGRNLWNSEEERSQIGLKYQDREEEKNKIRDKLKDNNSDIEPNEKNIKKYRLWEDQSEKLWILKKKKTKSGDWKQYWDRKTKIEETKDGGICLYCAKPINVFDLKNTEIDHIIPQSRWANDSYDNLVLSCKDCNNKKKQKKLFEYFYSEKQKKEFEERVANLYKVRNRPKYDIIQIALSEDWGQKLDDFISRNLNDTRMIATYLKRYIEKYQKAKVQPIKGSITSYFRKQIFDRGSVFYYKEQLRSLTPYHHAIDAIVLAHFKSRGYTQLMEDLIIINRNKRKLEKQELAQEEFDSCYQEIIQKWSKENSKEYGLLDKYTKDAIKILEKAVKQKENNVSRFFLISDLKNIIEQRIPVRLKVEKEEKEKVREVVISVKEVLTEGEYYERVKDQRGNIHYPYISYVSDQKVKKETIASEQAGYRQATGKLILPDICEKLRSEEKLELPKNTSLSKLVEKIGLEKLNSECGEKHNFLVVRDKQKKDNYTIWDTSKYAGFGVKNNGKAEKIKNIELFRRKKSGNRNWLTENYKWLLRPHETFTFDYSENLESELMKLVGLPLIYTGTTSDNVKDIDIVGLVEKKNSKENLKVIYPEHSDKIIRVKNVINSLGTVKKSIKKISPSIKTLKISILGKKAE